MDLELQEKLINFFKQFKKIEYSKGETLIRADDEPSGVYFITKGYVKMSNIFEDGSEIAVNIFKPGSFLPMMWALGDIDNTYFYKAITPTETYRAPKEKFLDFLSKHPQILFDLTARVLRGLDGIITLNKYMLSADSFKKVVVIIRNLSKRFGQNGKGEIIEIVIPMTHQDIAHFAGITRETVSIAMEKLKKQKIITQSKRRIIILDVHKLENLADPS